MGEPRPGINRCGSTPITRAMGNGHNVAVAGHLGGGEGRTYNGGLPLPNPA